MKVPSTDKARTTIDRSKERLVLVHGTGETIVRFMSCTNEHPAGSWYIESGMPLLVDKIVGGKRKRLRFTALGEEVIGS